MKKFWLWGALALALGLWGLVPGKTTDVGDLVPAQILLVERENGLLTASCDAGATGRGVTLDQALLDMEQTCPGKLFLDTAQAVVFHLSAQDAVAQAAKSAYLRPAAQVYLAEGELPQAEDLLEFLRTRPGDVTLARVRAGLLGAGAARLPRLENREGRLRLIEP